MRRFSSSGTRHESGSMGAPWFPLPAGLWSDVQLPLSGMRKPTDTRHAVASLLRSTSSEVWFSGDVLGASLSGSSR